MSSKSENKKEIGRLLDYLESNNINLKDFRLVYFIPCIHHIKNGEAEVEEFNIKFEKIEEEDYE